MRRLYALGLADSRAPVLRALGAVLEKVNEDQEDELVRLEYQASRSTAEEIAAIEASLPPPPAPNGVARHFDPDTETFGDLP
jgi:hypothetical protein